MLLLLIKRIPGRLYDLDRRMPSHTQDSDQKQREQEIIVYPVLSLSPSSGCD